MLFADLAGWLLVQPPRLGPVRLVTVDGPAGSGKSTFARRLAAAVVGAGATSQVLEMDDFYAGWKDLEGSWQRVQEWVLTPLGEGRPGRRRRYDWFAERFGETWYDVPLTDVAIVEGVGSGRRAGESSTTLAVWVEAPRDLRLCRGIERDGEPSRELWLRWQDDEDAHFTRERTRERAALLVDGAGSPADGAISVLVDRRVRDAGRAER